MRIIEVGALNTQVVVQIFTTRAVGIFTNGKRNLPIDVHLFHVGGLNIFGAAAMLILRIMSETVRS